MHFHERRMIIIVDAVVFRLLLGIFPYGGPSDGCVDMVMILWMALSAACAQATTDACTYVPVVQHLAHAWAATLQPPARLRP